jgi:hypothetical protein
MLKDFLTKERTTAPAQEPAINRRAAVTLIVASLAAAGAGAYVYAVKSPHPNLLKLQLSHDEWPTTHGAALHEITSALRWALVLTASGGLGLLGATFLAWKVFWTPYARSIARAGIVLTVVGAAAYVAADLLVLVAARAPGAGQTSALLTTATSFTVLTVCCATPATAIAAVAVLSTTARFASHWEDDFARRKVATIIPPPLEGHDKTHAWPEARDDGGAARWRRGFVVPGFRTTEDMDAHLATSRVGFCLSGGGVRSASFALGALQTLRKELLEARYLISVSGGGYTAGALQLAVTDQLDPDAQPDEMAGANVRHDVEMAYQPGSVEEDYLRRHINYLADSPGRMLVALGVVTRSLVLSLTVLFGTAVVLGVAAGRAYDAVQVAPWSAGSLHPWAPTLTYPTVRPGTWWLLVGLAGIAAACYATGLIGMAYSKRPWQLPGLLGGVVTCVGLLVAALSVGVPSVVYGAAWLLRGPHGSYTVGSSIGSVLLAYLTTLGAFGRRAKVGSRVKGLFGGSKPTAGAVPAGALRLVLVSATLILLAAAWVLLFGGVAAVADGLSTVVAAAVIAGGLLIFGGILDQTALSLHPFYRRRLAGAFAARRVERHDGFVIAQPYPYGERTRLSTYAKRPTPEAADDAPGTRKTFPEVVFAAAANLTGEQRAPLNAASFTFNADWIGGPDVGYMKTAELEAVVKPQLARDLTVEAAMAISGAAVASAMGRASRWYGTLLAVTGTRLGSWLPNPGFVDVWCSARTHENHDWTVPGIPRLRRLTYLLREVLGMHRCTDRLLQITDGGHYENLGLVEALRRRCKVVYCIDASGDTPPTAGTLADAIALAYEELGVSIELDDGSEAWRVVPGSAEPLEPKDPLSALNARLSERVVLTGRITYPPESGLPKGERTGTLVVAKALLTPGMPYDVLSYAARNAAFPRDSTGDQFFDDDKYCAYTALGRVVADHARAALARHDAMVAEKKPRVEPAPAPDLLGARAEAPTAPAVGGVGIDPTQAAGDGGVTVTTPAAGTGGVPQPRAPQEGARWRAAVRIVPFHVEAEVNEETREVVDVRPRTKARHMLDGRRWTLRRAGRP